ncbi:protein spindle-F [Drosophila sulfurigaster albostrigata]|uniref:protein spindle-F n=1 Tax=Drosophila sulfurigaster albostrigata TaxID=89887 RepID=UPI002D219647|nr:protein spindle-F [Drosophila sulfurigaster albostrigata]
MWRMDSNTDKGTSGRTTSSSSTNNDKMNYALQVALQTMKERCIQLQRQVSVIEDENQRLRDGNTHEKALTNKITQGKVEDNRDDAVSLRCQVNELLRQKEKLEHQINMVSDENRKLWSRLSKISKDNYQAQLPKENDIGTVNASMGSNHNLNLIRSKTFTQHSPNPHLRKKVISERSFEDITLAGFDTGEELAYAYGLQVNDAISDPDANIDARKCMEGLQDLRREAMKQQQTLNVVYTQLESRFALRPCPDCAKNSAIKPEMADKSLETEERLTTDLKAYHSENSTSSQLHYTFTGHPTISQGSLPRSNILQEKLKADVIDKTCPMCGKLYSSQVPFKAFQEHVEMHFIDDTPDADASVDRQFEFISHAVGDF